MLTTYILVLVGTLLISALSGIIDGAVEAYSLNRKLFETIWNKPALGYWGSKSSLLAYKNNDPTQGFKNLYTKYLGAWDFYHNADDIRKASYLLQLVFVYYLLGLNSVNNIIFLLIPYIVAFMLSGFFKRITFNKLRKLAK